MKITIILIFLLSIIPVTASLEETMKDAINQIQIPEYAKRILPVTGRIITTDTGERIYLKLDINDLTIIEPVEEYDIELKTTLKLIQETMPLNSQEEIKLKIQQNYENIELKSKTWKGE